MSISSRFGLLFAIALVGCGHATRSAAPQSGTAQLTAATVAQHVERVLVADKGTVGLVARNGCVATIGSGQDDTGSFDEMRVRCPRSERLSSWFGALDKMTATLPVEAVDGDTDIDAKGLPAAELAMPNGRVMKLTRQEDATRVLGEVRAFAAELDAAERPAPGPATDNGWQMLRVSGPAHVLFAGEATRGVLDVRVSSTGQYLCEYNANTNDGPFHASKSGWIKAETATRALDEVLAPFRALGPDERPRSTYALAVQGGNEQKANAASTAAVFERVGPLQDALGDACIAELEEPAPVGQ